MAAMSYLTEVTVILEGVAPLTLQGALTADVREGQGLRELDSNAAGGRKVYCSTVFAAMFNHVAAPEVLEFLATIQWGYSSAIVVISCESFDNEPDPQVYEFSNQFPNGQRVPLPSDR